MIRAVEMIALPMRNPQRCLLSLIVVCLLPVFTSVKLVLRTNSLTVKVGRTVFLDRDDIVIKSLKKRVKDCRIEVVQGDAITQRVGKLEPKVFDCSYHANIVKYTHNGSPFLTEDRIKLQVHRFTNRKTVTETFYLSVKVSNASTDIVVTQGLRHVIVPEFNGISNTIDASVLRFYHSRSPNVSCTVSFDKSMHWPLAGHIIMGDNWVPVETIRTSCQEFLFMELRYEHLRKAALDVDYFPLSIELSYPEDSEEFKAERFFLPIYIKNVLLNSPPRSSNKSMYMMDVDQFVLTTIMPGIISAEDYETPDHLLIYNVSKPMKPDQGYLLHLSDQTTAITSFLQDDLDNHRIAYQPPNTSFSERRTYEVEFKVYDSHFAESLPIVLHVTVCPLTSNAPHVSYNTGLVLLEGQSREISSSNLQIVDNNNPNDVRVFIIDGPKHGQLLLNNENIHFFTISDLVQGSVKYIHDDSESEKDSIKLKVSDGTNDAIVNFPIKIISKDDRAPYVVNNIGLELKWGQTKALKPVNLLAHDTDSMDMTITYVIAQATAAGELIRKTKFSYSGTRVNRFTQRELVNRQIYYRHFGREDFHDEFLFTLRDQQDPPNESSLETFYIKVNPAHENPPQSSPEAIRLMRVPETDVTLITKSVLEYTDTETGSDKLIYIITTPPYFVYNNRHNRRENAGRVIAMRNLTLHRKSNDIPPVTTFKQEDINNLEIGYMPPVKDIGPEPRLVRFVYTVQGASGSTRFGQQFDMEIQPVNDKAPVFHSSKMLVEEGGILVISTNHISAVDIDTNEADLLFILEDLPNHGHLKKGGHILLEKNTFRMFDLRKKDLRYIHDGSEVPRDVFTMSLSDGNNRVSNVFEVEVVPVDDIAPKVKQILKPHLIVSEGSEAVINSIDLSATDEDTDDGTLVFLFLIVKQPKCGILQLHDEPTSKRTNISLINNGLDVMEGERAIVTTVSLSASDESTCAEEIIFAIIRPPNLGQLEYIERPFVGISNFTQMDIASGKVVYNHVTKADITEDAFTFTVANGMGGDIKFSEFVIRVEPMDKELPSLIINELVEVLQGAEIPITSKSLTADDPDTDSSNVTYLIAKQPTFGRLYNRGVYITRLFTQNAVNRGFITYESDGSNTRLDNFLFTLSDGKHNGFLINDTLQLQPVLCTIYTKPLVNDAPKLITNQHPEFLEIFEDGRSGFQLNNHVLKAVDSDTMNTNLVYVIEQRPKHGYLENREVKRYVRRGFTQRDLDKNKLRFIIDMKDKETNDSFTFKVEDSRGYSLKNQRIDFRWSYIELDKTELVVCENIGTLPLTLTRTGDLSGEALVEIEEQDTTRIYHDFRPSLSKQVKFDPGVSTVTWNIQIIDDGIKENTENFVVYINYPVNAILGRRRKARIRLINADDGECPQYIGMISKHQPTVSETLYMPDNAIEKETETALQGSQFKRASNQESHDDNILPDPAEKSSVDTTSPEIVVQKKTPTVEAQRKYKKRRKKQKERKDKKKRERNGRKKNKPCKTKGGEDISEQTARSVLSVQLMENVNINDCTLTTKGLIYFDPGTQQMYKCIGNAWQVLSVTSNKDQQAETKECRQGWSKFENRCFKFINERLTLEVAEILCQMPYGANMATIKSPGYQLWFLNLTGRKAYLIGLSSNADTGRWSYSNGESLSFSYLKARGQRMKRTLSRNSCVIIDKKQKWSNKICRKRKARFICEIDIGASDPSRSPLKRDISRSHDKKRKKNRHRDRKNDGIRNNYRERDSRRFGRTSNKWSSFGG